MYKHIIIEGPEALRERHEHCEPGGPGRGPGQAEGPRVLYSILAYCVIAYVSLI